MRLAVVGCEASGKTVFMAALADYYRPDKQGVVEKQTLSIKRRLKQALEKTVR